MSKLKMVRYNPGLLEEFVQKYPVFKGLKPQDLVAIMLRKALEAKE